MCIELNLYIINLKKCSILLKFYLYNRKKIAAKVLGIFNHFTTAYI